MAPILYFLIFSFHFSNKINQLEAKVLQLQVDLSHANNELFKFGKQLTKQKGTNKNLMDRIQTFKKSERENQKRNKNNLQGECSIPAAEEEDDELQIKKVDLIQ